MADQHKAKKPWTTPVIRRLEGEEAERMRAIMMERAGWPDEPQVRKSAAR